MEMRVEHVVKPGHEPRAQGDGSPEPVYTVDVPEQGFELRVTVQVVPRVTDERELGETGYGHGV